MDVAEHADRLLRFRSRQRIAAFVSLREEIDTAPLLALLRQRGHRLYLPRITSVRGKTLRFVAAAGRPMRANRYGIPEPQTLRSVRPTDLDIVFVPLVAFDGRGARLGMGAGFYDRAFAFKRLRSQWRRPRLVGLAYACQQVERLIESRHDVRLDAVITERGIITFPAPGAPR